MARPIKDTPALVGKDALKFIADMKKYENKKVDEKTRQRMLDNYNKLQSIAQF